MQASDDQKSDLEQLQQDLNDIIQLTQFSILKKISEAPKQTNQDTIKVSLFKPYSLKIKTNYNLNLNRRMMWKRLKE